MMIDVDSSSFENKFNYKKFRKRWIKS